MLNSLISGNKQVVEEYLNQMEPKEREQIRNKLNKAYKEFELKSKNNIN